MLVELPPISRKMVLEWARRVGHVERIYMELETRSMKSRK